MDTRIALGQRLSVGFEGTTLTEDLKRILGQSRIGNIILFRRNIESFEQLFHLCRDLNEFIEAETGYPPFIMLDEECGAVSRLAHIAGPTPCAMAIGETGDETNAAQVARQIGRQLRAVGVNFNLAPVLDCFTDKRGIATGNRSFGEDPEQVARMGTAYVHGLHEAGILTCCKHFPGSGCTKVDSHLALPVIDRSLEQMEALELIPFRKAIQAGTDAIMTAHLMMPQLEKQPVPATLSHAIMTDLLRDHLGFDGILISDSLEMHAVMDAYPFDQSMTMAFTAGVDIALICHNPAAAAEALAAQDTALHHGKLREADVAASLSRIQRYKQRMGVPTGNRDEFIAPEYQRFASALLRQVIRVTPDVNGKGLFRPDGHTAFVGFESFRASNAGDATHYQAAKILADHFGAIYWPTVPETVSQLNLQDCRNAVVIMEYDGKPENQQYLELTNHLLSLKKPVVVISMFTPTVLELFPDTVVKVCAWQYDALSVGALIELFEEQ